MKLRFTILVLLFVAGTGLRGQYSKEFKRIFFDADYLMETGFYEEAFNRYKNLLTLDPGNSNILFHCGASCLKIPGNEEQAIGYLKEASEGVSLKYKDKSHKESGAPVMTYFLLGQAYHLNSRYSEAIAEYNQYLEVGSDQDPVQLEYARVQIEACNRAASIKRSHPAYELRGVLEHFKEDLPSCSNPVISGDGRILIFLVDYPSDKKIMMSTRSDSLWSRPRVINSELGMVGETYPTSISYDGKDLYLVHQYYSHSDIFVSHLEGKRWTEAAALGYQINGRTSENHASISKDGKSLYFTSDARGGEGSFDIYVSHLSERGDWGEAVNLGPTINTVFEEHTPFISNNDSVLFFSSQGHATMGGLDVFQSTLQSDGTWSEPENIGYPVNTTGDDLFFNPGWNQMESYYAVRREDDPKSNAINVALKLDYEEEEVVAEAELIEPPNTDKIEMVLNDREALAETESDAETSFVTQVSDPLRTRIPNTEPQFVEELLTAIPFLLNKYEMGPAAQLEVERVAELMAYHPQSRVELTGYTDFTGEEDFNMILSHYRAETVAEYLEMRGISRERIQVDGRGETDPLAINRYSDGRDALLGRYINRTVKVRVLGTFPASARLSGLYIPDNLKPDKDGNPFPEYEFHYTIQLMAASMPVPESQFNDIMELKEYVCEDGLYRYTTGSFRRFQEARVRLIQLRKRGYPDAYIQTREWYEKAVK